MQFWAGNIFFNDQRLVRTGNEYLVSFFFLGSLDDLEDDEYTQMNGAFSRLSRGKQRFPKGHYLDDYDDIPISMVPRSHPLQMPRLDADDDPNGYIAMETEATEAETANASSSKTCSISRNHGNY